LSDIFVRDLRSHTTRRVSVDAGGHDPNGASTAPSISDDGRFVTFQSDADDLVPGDTNGVNDVFLYDMLTRSTSRISVGVGISDPTRQVGSSSVSADGSRVAFHISVGSPVTRTDVFVRDRVAHRTVKVSVSAIGGQADGSSIFPTISKNGRYVAFLSGAENLVPGDDNGFSDIFRRDLATHQTRLVSVDRFGGATDEDAFSGSPAISADGRYVVFHDAAGDLVPGDTNGEPDVFRRDLAEGTTVRISVTSDEEQVSGFGNFHTVRMGISDRGRFVTFSSDFSELAANDRNGQPDVFLRDVVRGTTTLVSAVPSPTGPGEESPNGFSTEPSISRFGCFVAFSSSASGLTPDDKNDAVDDVFRRALFPGHRQCSRG
jgi:Tol biopolymer transport system component